MKDPLKQFESQLKVDAFINTSAPDYNTCFENAREAALDDIRGIIPYLENMSIEEFTERNPRIKEFYDSQKKA